MKPVDVVIVGAGHNGLVCACDLAARGLSVQVLEARPVVGGAAVTEEFHPGFRNSTASYTVSLLDEDIIRDLKLAAHGLSIIERPFSNFLPLPDGRFLKMGGGLAASQAEVARFSERDAQALPRYYAMLDRVVPVLRQMVRQTPPNLGEHSFGSLSDWFSAMKTARALTQADLETKRDLATLCAASAADVLDQWFESEPIKAVFGFDAVVGHFASPYTPGSAYVLLHHVFGGVNGKAGTWGHARGGMGAITQALAHEAGARGVQIATGTPVARILVEGGRAVGVETANGQRIQARRVVANVTPRLLFEKLVSSDALPDERAERYRERILRTRYGSGTLRMNVALSELPDFTALPGRSPQPHHSAGIILAPSLDYMDRAFQDARAQGFAPQPIVEVLIPSTVDDSLAPAGQHVASLFCQHFAYDLPRERYPGGWDEARAAAADAAIATVTRFAPNFQSSIVARQIHTPLDLERKFGLTRGDIFHGHLALDQLFAARPILGGANYRTPIAGLYLCGSGAHPGGGVTGLPGRNAAREILRDR